MAASVSAHNVATSTSRRSSLNPFHHTKRSPSPSNPPSNPATEALQQEAQVPTERRRSSVVELLKKAGHVIAEDAKNNQRAFEVYYGAGRAGSPNAPDAVRRDSLRGQSPARRESVVAKENREKEEERNQVY